MKAEIVFFVFRDMGLPGPKPLHCILRASKSRI